MSYQVFWLLFNFITKLDELLSPKLQNFSSDTSTRGPVFLQSSWKHPRAFLMKQQKQITDVAELFFLNILDNDPKRMKETKSNHRCCYIGFWEHLLCPSLNITMNLGPQKIQLWIGHMIKGFRFQSWICHFFQFFWICK